jgi:hypothetical protein
MAAFLARLAAALTPTVLRAESPSATFAANSVACQTADVELVSPRTAIVRTRVTARTLSASSIVRAGAVVSVDAGQTWWNLALDGGAAGEVASSQVATLNDYAVIELEPGQQARFGLRIEGAALQGSCTLSAELVNRNRSAAPF